MLMPMMYNDGKNPPSKSFAPFFIINIYGRNNLFRLRTG